MVFNVEKRDTVNESETFKGKPDTEHGYAEYGTRCIHYFCEKRFDKGKKINEIKESFSSEKSLRMGDRSPPKNKSIPWPLSQSRIQKKLSF
ncbi:hypothetical protein CEXT_487571 [Caerostris extrusa]|uniref:Uncharacterized protein n=1 Tax=Caerostris extrusa TaxID=172846 RepID=A0AAV4Q3V1_CAEEX|nr:hypothetical protein CEXT_487571 [Caerostris extrusa]